MTKSMGSLLKGASLGLVAVCLSTAPLASAAEGEIWPCPGASYDFCVTPQHSCPGEKGGPRMTVYWQLARPAETHSATLTLKDADGKHRVVRIGGQDLQPVEGDTSGLRFQASYLRRNLLFGLKPGRINAALVPRGEDGMPLMRVRRSWFFAHPPGYSAWLWLGEGEAESAGDDGRRWSGTLAAREAMFGNLRISGLRFHGYKCIQRSGTAAGPCRPPVEASLPKLSESNLRKGLARFPARAFAPGDYAFTLGFADPLGPYYAVGASFKGELICEEG